MCISMEKRYFSISVSIPMGRNTLGPEQQCSEGIRVARKRKAKTRRQMKVSNETDAKN